MNKDEAITLLRGIEAEINDIIIGQENMVRQLLVGLFTEIPYSFKKDDEANGHRGGCAHILLEGVPGVAKTLAVVAISSMIHAKFQRIQLTPDLLPADIVGTRIFDPAKGTFGVERGPIFTNILLADEINRATPKTQSALLEAMQERQVTLGENTFKLDDPFWVLATQNPVEQEGVYILPEAQKDRFSMMLRVEYPGHEDELKMLGADIGQIQLKPLFELTAVVKIRELIRGTYVDERLREYIVRLGRATRDPKDFGLDKIAEAVTVGISPRAYHHLLALAKTMAFFHEREYVTPEDVKEVAIPALRHRIIRSVQAEAARLSTDDILEDILEQIPIP
jgi:MoxR-like ATPase